MFSQKQTNVAFIILAVVLAGAVGYFAFAERKNIAEKPARVQEKNVSRTPETFRRAEKENWKSYQNKKYGFTISYPSYLKSLKSEPLHFFEASSSAEMIQIKISEKPLDGSEFLAADGTVGDSIFKYFAAKNEWQYVGMYGGPESFGDKDKYKVYDVRPEDGAYLRKEGRVPVKYKTKNGLSVWVGKSTDKHSTQGGDSWQIAFIESPQKQFTVKVYMKQCHGFYNSCGGKTESSGDSQTIFSVIDTLRFGDF